MKTPLTITKWLAVLAFASISFQPSTGFAQGTAFTYQGRLYDGANPANGRYDLRFNLYDALSAGSLVAGPLTNAPVTVSNGLFTVTLDFGAGVFTGPSRWLEVGARSNGVAVVFTVLTPRQPLTPTPYAIFAETASASGLSGTVGNGQLANNSVTVRAGTGLSGGGAVALGGSTTLNNAGVLSVTGNPDITAAPNTGNVALGSTATDVNAASRIVKRDASGNFSAGTVTLAGNLNLPATTATSGAIYAGGNLLMHEYGSGNFFAGLAAGNLTMSGVDNVGIGNYALDANTLGNYNTALGYNALTYNTNGSYNTAVGYLAGYSAPDGYENTAVGYGAGYYPTNGFYNIHIGAYGAYGDSQIIRIGMPGYQTDAYIAGIYGNIVSNGTPVYVDSNGQLGSSASSPVALLGANQTFTGVVNLNNAGNTFTGNGSGLTSVNADSVDGLNASAFWQLTGNAGTTGGVNFVGTTDNQPMELRVNNTRALRLEYGSGIPNLIVNPYFNSMNTYGSTIAGGYNNQIQSGAYYSLIGGGYNNQVQTNCYYCVIAGGIANQIQGSASYSAHYGAIGGGYGNVIEAYGYNSVIAGGYGNRVQYNGDDAAIGGGASNLIGTNADYATISGGYNNTANGYGATIPGGYNNNANGYYSFAAGRNATANDNNSFVWSDGTYGTNSGANSFDIFASGGVHINQTDLFLRSGNDRNHGLGYRDSVEGIFFDGPFLYGFNGGALGVANPDTVTLKWDYVGNVWISNNCSVATLTIRGGADLAEPFDIAGKEATEGAVVVIDEQNPGHLKVSDSPYDTHVAGVVSGANGINPGIQMHQQGLIEGGKNVALTGRVYVRADAANGAIRPGDMLTTSSTPGHAMKVSDHAKAAGAILGKAMTGLSEGKGLVLVLVTLQ